MSLSNASFKEDSTAITATAGTTANLVSVGDDSKSHALYWGSGSYLERSNVEFSISEPQTSSTSPSGYTQGRGNLVMKEPKVLANEELTFNTFRATLAVDVETTQAEIDEMCRNAAQFITSPDFQNFWRNRSLG